MADYRDPNNVNPNGSYSITQLVKFIREKMFGIDVRESIAKALERVYEDASKDGNANMEVSQARGLFGLLKDRLDNSDRGLAQKADRTYVDAVLSSIAAGGPKELFYSLVALQTKYPQGAEGTYIVFDVIHTDSAHSYMWNGSIWEDLGPYQGLEIPDESVTEKKVADRAISREKLQFLQPRFTNILNPNTYIPEEYFSILDGTIIKKGDADYSPDFGRTPLMRLPDQSKRLYRNGYMGRDNGNVHITFFSDPNGVNFLSGTTWGLNTLNIPDLGSEEVYFSVAWINLNLEKSILTIDEPIVYEDAETLPSLKNLTSILGMSRTTANLISADDGSNWEIKVDFNQRELIFAKKRMFAMFGNAYSWVWNTQQDEDVVFTYDDLANLSNRDPSGPVYYFYIFVHKDMEIRGRDKFKVIEGIHFNIDQTRDVYQNYAYLGAVVFHAKIASFPGTRVITVGGSYSDLKKISILGDSLSTFQGYNPVGNAVYYPTSYLTSVEDTWWKRLIEKSEGKLELLINESWSGSRVSDNRGVEQAGATRALNLDSNGENPNIIINFIGTNDFNYDIPFGDFGGNQSPPTAISTFSDAYTVMLENESSKYPNAKIYCCTLPFNSRGGFPRVNSDGVSLSEFNQRIRDISKLYGAEIIDLERVGINKNNINLVTGEGLHFNSVGMEIVRKKMQDTIF